MHHASTVSRRDLLALAAGASATGLFSPSLYAQAAWPS